MLVLTQIHMLPLVHLIRTQNGDFLSFAEPSGISGTLFVSGVWDSAVIKLAECLIQASSRTPLVLDIGSNMGSFTVPTAKFIESKGGQVLAFEPQRTIFYQLCGNIFLNRLENITAYNIALSNKTGIYPISIVDFDKANNNGAFSVIDDNPRQPVTEKKEKCLFAELDQFEIDEQISLIKLDVEGSELNVLSSAMKRIANDGFPPIIFEANSDTTNQSLFDFLIKNEYKISNIPSMEGDFFAQHPSWESEIEIQTKNGISTVMRIR